MLKKFSKNCSGLYPDFRRLKFKRHIFSLQRTKENVASNMFPASHGLIVAGVADNFAEFFPLPPLLYNFPWHDAELTV
jgi:hypothetical protein